MRPSLQRIPTQAAVSSRKTWQDNGCSHPSQAEGKVRATSCACCQVSLLAQSSLFSPVINDARAASALQKRCSRSKHHLHGTETDSQEPCPLTQSSLQLLVPHATSREVAGHHIKLRTVARRGSSLCAQ